MCTPSEIKKYGAKPTNVQWTVVRGDTAILQIEFYESDGTTSWDTEGWTYEATVYDTAGDVLDSLDVDLSEGYVTISASPEVTGRWGAGYKSIVAELPFDLQVKIPSESGEDIIWTPVIGNVVVLGDVTPGGGL
jgi:hypothetical protein